MRHLFNLNVCFGTKINFFIPLIDNIFEIVITLTLVKAVMFSIMWFILGRFLILAVEGLNLGSGYCDLNFGCDPTFLRKNTVKQ